MHGDGRSSLRSRHLVWTLRLEVKRQTTEFEDSPYLMRPVLCEPCFVDSASPERSQQVSQTRRQRSCR
jgi:hypothetical protein